MNNVKNALTRKFGPLPVWAWALVAGILLYYYRNRSGTVGTQSGTGTGSVAPGPGLQPLLPNQSYYDPATPGQFFTTPPDSQNGPMPRSPAHILKHHRHKRKKGEKPRRGIKLPGRRAKGGTAHKTHVSRARPDRIEDRKRDRRKTRVPRPMKARPTGGVSATPPNPNAGPRFAPPRTEARATRAPSRPTRRPPARRH